MCPSRGAFIGPVAAQADGGLLVADGVAGTFVGGAGVGAGVETEAVAGVVGMTEAVAGAVGMTETGGTDGEGAAGAASGDDEGHGDERCSRE